MAWDKVFINEVRVWFETHDDDATAVAQKFSVPSTSMSTWINQGRENDGVKWVKGKYKSHLEAAKRITKDQIASDINAAIKKELEQEILSNIPEPTDKDKQNAEDVADALILDMLVIENLNKEMAWSVVKAKSFAKTAKSIGTIEIYTKIIERAKNQIFGKDPDIVNIFAASNTNIVPADLKGKSTDELIALMKLKTDEAERERAKKEAIDTEAVANGEN